MPRRGAWVIVLPRKRNAGVACTEGGISMRTLAVVVSVLAFQIPVVATTVTPARAACDTAGDVLADCFERFKDAASEVVRTDRDEVRERVGTVRDVLRECLDCATRTYRDNMRDFSVQDADTDYSGHSQVDETGE
jgi:hypothetical protein